MASATTKKTGKPELKERHLNALKKRSNMSEEEIRAAFEDFHKTAATGQLTQAEFVELWKQSAPPNASDDVEMAKRLFASFDRDHSGKVDFNEFLMANALITPGAPTHKVALLFAMCDFNQDGYLTQDEIEHIFKVAKSVQGTENEKEFASFKAHLNTVFPQYDANKDGKMSQREFRNLCTKDEVFKTIIV